MRLLVLSVLLFLVLLPSAFAAEPVFSGAADLELAIGRLNNLGRVLMIAAHPDDENTALLAWWARGRKLKTGYLSLTRGEGGQNLIGSEQGPLMGVIRTQELLAARRMDGAQQFFTRAIDFGFTKTVEETFQKWGRQETLGDIVWVIRQFQPDVIVLRFSGTPRDGHGQHQASAILGKEAFSAAADPKRFPEQLQWVKPWQAKRVLWNVFAFNRQAADEAARMPGAIRENPGRYDPVLGYSFREIAGMSRSQHRSQGMGAPQSKGSSLEYLVPVAGEPARTDLFDGIDTSWNRIPGGAAVGALVADLQQNFRYDHPAGSLGQLLAIRSALQKIDDPRAKEKMTEVDEAIALVTGLWLEARAARPAAVPGTELGVQLIAVNRSDVRVSLSAAALVASSGRHTIESLPAQLTGNEEKTFSTRYRIAPSEPYSQPYWLRLGPEEARYQVADPTVIGRPENGPWLEARFEVEIEGQKIEYRRPVEYYEVDPQIGEKRRPLALVPPVSVEMTEPVVLFRETKPRALDVRLQATAQPVAGVLRLETPAGWRAGPDTREVALETAGEQSLARFTVTPPAGPSDVSVRAAAGAAGKSVSDTVRVIEYPHIPPQTVLLPALARVIRADVVTLAQNVGYIMGAGDEVPKALEQLGCRVTLLDDAQIAQGDLSRFDAIVAGVRAYNTRPVLAANRKRLMDYVAAGGTYVVQYNVLPFRMLRPNEPDPLAEIGPHPIRFGRERVTVEDAPMKFLNPAHPVMTVPNHLTSADFEGWVQERGLYFAVEWADAYTPLFESSDPGEEPLRGSTLVARHGKGAYVFTALSFFRQLPAGVPGAYRLFANLLSAGKTVQ